MLEPYAVMPLVRRCAGAISDDRPYRDTQAGVAEQELSGLSRTPTNLCSGFCPGLERGTERDGFTQSGASMEEAALGCGNGNVQNLRCFLDGQFLKLGHFDDRAYTRPESMYGAVKNGSALALHIGLLRIWGTIRDLKMQSRFAGRGQLVRGNLARTTILAINHEGRIHDNARDNGMLVEAVVHRKVLIDMREYAGSLDVRRIEFWMTRIVLG